MTTIGDLQQGLNDLPVDVLGSEDRDAVYRALEFLETLPGELDVASAEYYLRKEFKRNDTGVDNRTEIFTFDPEPADNEGYWDSSGYDDDDDDWEDDYY